MVTVNSDEETESKIDVKRESIELMPNDMEKGIIDADEVNDDDDVCHVKSEDDEKMQSDTDTPPRTAAIGNKICDDDDDGSSSSEHELTNLGWLIDLKNLAQWPVDSANTAHRKHSNGNAHNSLVNGIVMNDIDDDENNILPAISEKDLSEERFKKFTIQVKQ